MSASLPDNISLHGLIAIVTGGSRGIGKEISLELARRGASISIVFANPAKTNIANDTVNEINALGGGVKAIAILADLKDASSYEKIVQKTLTGLDTKIINILGL
jgi:NAD(P)-dependent dehydrogenase (short-subunit alcohol dehydrogenase family)